MLAPLTAWLPDLAAPAGSVGRRAQAVLLALTAILILLSPIAARAADGDGCTYLKNDPASYDNGAYVITSGPVTRAAPPGNQTGIVNYASGTVLYYSYTVSDPSITARLTYAGLSGLGIDIVPATSTGGSGSFTLPVDSRVVTPSATIPGAGPGGTVTWTVYCGVRATQAVATTTGTMGTAMNFTPVTASFGRGTHTYALSGGTLPGGLSFNTGSGAITGTPTAALAATTFTVTVTHQGTGSASQTFQLTVSAPAPTVSAVSPVSGPTGGGSAVTITGTGFATAGSTGAVLFGAAPATYTIDSDTQIIATAPAGTAGTVDVTVTTPGGTSATSAADRYTYVAAPTVTALSPPSGPIAGGTSVAITGSGFLAAAPTGAVKFGANAATYTIVTDTQITATSPGAAAGTVDVTVTTTGGTSATSAADQFTYVAAPTIGAPSPASGPAAGGTTVTLTGTNLTGATLTVGGASVTPTGTTATTVTFVTPAHAGGAVNVVVTTAGGSASTSFTYVAAPVASSFTAFAVAYNATGVTFSVAGHATNSPTSFAVGSATTANGGSVSIDSTGLVTYDAPTGMRGNDSFTFTATNPGGTSSPATVTVPVSNPVLSSTLTGSGTRGTALSGVLIGTSGGTSPYGCATTPASGALPADTELNSDCSISGTPAASGDFTFTANVTDNSTGTGPFTQATGSLTLSIAAPTIGLSPAAGSLPDGAVGASYTQSFTATGGTAAYVYAHTGGTLPPGLSLAGNVLSGTPTATGTFDFDITATDSSTVGSGGPYTKTLAYSIVVGSGTQTISFGSLSDISLSSPPPPLSATASSGLTVSFASTTPAICTVSGATVTLVDRGLCSITASQSGDADWGAASDVVQSFTVTPAALVLTPGAAIGLQVGAAYSQANPATGGLAPYAYALHAGALLPGTSLDASTGTVSGTPTVAGNFSYQLQVTDSQSLPVTTAGAIVTVTIAKGSQTISFTSTAPTVAVGGAPYTVSATASSALAASFSLDGASTGCALSGATVTFTSTGTCRINADQAGDSNWNAAPQLQQSFTVNEAPPVAADKSGVSVAYNSSGTAIDLSGSVSGVHASLAIDAAPAHGTASVAGDVVTYTPTTGYFGADSFTYTATGPGGTSAPATVSLTVATPAAPVAADRSGVSVAYDSAGTAIDLSGSISGVHSSIAIGTAPEHGTTSIAGDVVTYTPSAGYFGTDSFTYTATGPGGTSAPATVSLTVATPAAPVAADKSGVSVAYNSSGTAIDLSGSITGVHASIAIGTAPAQGTTSVAGDVVTYTPASGYFGADSFTYTATGPGGSSAPATVSLTVATPAAPVAADKSGVSVAYNSSGTAIDLSGSVSGVFASLAISTAPAHGSTSISGDVVTYTPADGYFGTDSFTYTATGPGGSSAPATVSLTVAPPVNFTFSPSGGALTEAMAGEDYSQQITASGGTGALIYSVAPGALPTGLVLNISTGKLTGPLAADTEGDYSFTIEVRDGNGSTGTASYTLKVGQRSVTVTDKVVNIPPGSSPNDVYLNAGATGGPFTSAEITFVEPADGGTATIIRGQLAQAGPAVTPVGWYLQFRPNPAYSGGVRVGFRLTSGLGVSNTGTVAYNFGYDASAVAQHIDTLVRGFVETRQSLIASTIEVPGLLDRRRMERAGDLVTTRVLPSADGLTLGFATSLAQTKAARDGTDGAGGADVSPFNVWIDGTPLAHNRDENDGRWGSFAMVSLGADYLLSEKALLGLSIHYDRMSDPTDEDAKLTGNGWLAGPYASFQIGRNVFWDTSLFYGGSSNDIATPYWDGSFDTRRWLFDTSLEGQWLLDDTTVLTPRLRAVYLSETVDDYAIGNGGGDEIELEGFTQEQLRVSLGAEIARSFVLQGGSTLTPNLGVSGGFSGLDGSGAFGTVSTDLSLQTLNNWTIDAGLLFNVEGDGQTSLGAKLGFEGRF